MPTIFGYDLAQLADSDSYIDFLSFSANFGDLREVLEWEEFFLKIGCRLPHLDMDEILISGDIQLLNPSIFDETNLSVSTRLLTLLEEQYWVDTLSHLPVRAQCKANSSSVVPIGATFSQKLFKTHLPSIDYPDSCIDLAKAFGVTTELNFEACFKVLRLLVNEGSTNVDEFVEWFINIRKFMNQKVNSERLMDTPLIYLENLSSNAYAYYSLKDVYCITLNKESFSGQESIRNGPLLAVCEYLDKTVISANYNSSFLEIRSTLVGLGCSIEPSLGDLANCIIRMSSDENLFNQKNLQNILTNEGYFKFKEMFLMLENSLRQKLNLIQEMSCSNNKKALNYNLKERLDLLKRMQTMLTDIQIESNESCCFSQAEIHALTNMPIITYNRHLLHHFEISVKESVVACFQFDIIQMFRSRLGTLHTFFDIELAKSCPFLMGVLGVKYLDSLGDFFLEHTNSNMEQTSLDLNQRLAELTQIDSLQVLKVKYVALAFGKHKTNTSDTNENRIAIHNEFNYCILNKNLIVCPEKFGSRENFPLILAEAVIHLLKEINPSVEQNERYLIEIRNTTKELGYSCVGWRNW